MNTAARLVAAALLSLALLPATRAEAQPMEPVSGTDAESGVGGTFGVGFGAARLREDWYLNLTPSLLLRIGNLTIAREGELFGSPQTYPLKLALEAPLLIRVKDRAPTDSLPNFRRELWDEPAEYLRIVRWVEYGEPYGGVYLRGGELPDVRIGHRTIVDSYDNALDGDHFQWGFQGGLNTIYGGAEALVDNFTNPDVLALRLFVRPFAFVDEPGNLRRLAVGVTLAGDQSAPTLLARDPTGGGYARSEEGDVLVSSVEPTGLLGWDLEYQLVQTDTVSVTPYTDVNTHLSQGTGWHTGTFLGFRPIGALVLDARAEYRLMGGGYLPGYLGRLYEVERNTYLPVPGDPLMAPKLAFAQSLRAGVRQGYAAELGLNVASKIFVSAGWEDMTGANNNSAWARLRLPPIWKIQAGAYYVNSRFHRTPGLFDLDNALAVAELRFMLTKWLYLDGQYRRRWEVDGDGEYLPVDDWWFGAGASFGF